MGKMVEKTKQQMRGKSQRMGELGENAEKDGVESKGRDLSNPALGRKTRRLEVGDESIQW